MAPTYYGIVFTFYVSSSQAKRGRFFGTTFRATSTDCHCFASIVYYHYVVGLTRYSHRALNEGWESDADESITHPNYNYNWDICK